MHECSDKSHNLAGRYQVRDVVFPKNGPTFCPRLWSSAVLLTGGTRGSTVRGNVVINSTVPRRWDTAKDFNQPVTAVALENHQYDRPMDLPPKPEILSEIHYRVPFRSSVMIQTKDCFQTQTRQQVFSAMASNAMSRIVNQDGTCLVQILLSHTFSPWSFCTENEPFSTAERSERVENFLFCATREYMEAGIEQATVAMRCLGANSPEPRRRAVPGWHVSRRPAAI